VTFCTLYTSIPVPSTSVPIEDVCHPTLIPTHSVVDNDIYINYIMSSILPLTTTIINETKKTVLSTRYKRTTKKNI